MDPNDAFKKHPYANWPQNDRPGIDDDSFDAWIESIFRELPDADLRLLDSLGDDVRTSMVIEAKAGVTDLKKELLSGMADPHTVVREYVYRTLAQRLADADRPLLQRRLEELERHVDDKSLDEFSRMLRRIYLAEEPTRDIEHNFLGQDSRILPIYIDPGDAPAELVTELFVALAALYRAEGGTGLEIKNDEHRVLSGEVAI